MCEEYRGYKNLATFRLNVEWKHDKNYYHYILERTREIISKHDEGEREFTLANVLKDMTQDEQWQNEKEALPTLAAIFQSGFEMIDWIELAKEWIDAVEGGEV